MRCTNTACRAVFVIKAAEPEPAPAPPAASNAAAEDEGPADRSNSPRRADVWKPASQSSTWSGSVQDLLPVLNAEAAEEPPATPEAPAAKEEFIPLLPLDEEEARKLEPPRVEAPPEPPSWQSPPPVRQSPAARREPPKPTPSLPPAPAPQVPPRAKAPSLPAAAPARPPEVAPPPAAEVAAPAEPAPKVIDGPAELPPGVWEPPPVRRSAGTAEEPVAPPAIEEHPEPHPDVMPSSERGRATWIIAALVLFAGIVIGGVGYVALVVFAETEEKLFLQAKEEYQQGRFGRALAGFDKLIKEYPSSEQIRTYQFLSRLSEVRQRANEIEEQPGDTLQRVYTFIEEHKNSSLLKDHRHDVSQTLHKLADDLVALATREHEPAHIDQAEEAAGKAAALDPEAKQADLLSKFAGARAEIRRWRERKSLLEEGQELLAREPTVDQVAAWRAALRARKLDGDPEAKALDAKLDAAVRSLVRYVEDPRPATPGDEASAWIEPSLRVAPQVGGPAALPQANDRVFLALVRGVLYGLAQSNGQARWARRVGIDTTRLPVRLPATPSSRERFLVLSADGNTLTAVDVVTGEPIWQHRLTTPCLGRPVVVGRRAYVPTYDGRVNEIEIVEGRLLGYFTLRQPLSTGGVWQEGTDYVIFPADGQYVYVLDVAQNRPASEKKCAAILNTGHPSGAIRQEPIIIRRDTLPRSPGNPAAHDYLVLTQTDGLGHLRLRVFSLPTEGQEIAPLTQSEPRVRGWSWFQPYHDSEKIAFVTDAGELGLFGVNQLNNHDKPLFPELKEEFDLTGSSDRSERAQVVHAEENDFWLLANGELQRLHFNRYGGKMVRLWGQPITPGAPAHVSQVESAEQGKVLCLVTQSLSQPHYAATAVRAEDGTVLWQRQLGLECQDDPRVVGAQVVALDRSGSLLRFDPARQAGTPLEAWQPGGTLVGGPLPDGAIAPYLLPTRDGKAVYEVACPGKGTHLVVRAYGPPAGPAKGPLPLDAPLGGTPALGEGAEGAVDSVVLPLANGKLLRQPLDGQRGTLGLDWRAGRADRDRQGHVVSLNGRVFFVTDGSRGLKRLSWPTADEFKEEQRTELPARIVAAPVAWFQGEGDDTARVCVADAAGNVTLLHGRTLQPLRQWKLGSPVTTAPFLRNGKLGVVLDRQHLVWLDPAAEAPLWRYSLSGEGVVGQPQLIDGVLVVTDLSGRIVALDPATGQPEGPAYVLRASVAPAAAPTAYGPGRAFVPLTDGTVFLLDLGLVRHPLRSFPAR